MRFFYNPATWVILISLKVVVPLYGGNTDSLEYSLLQSPDSMKYEILKQLSDAYGTDSLEKSAGYLRRSLSLALKNRNMQQAVNSHIYIADLYWYGNQLDSALTNYRKALAFTMESNNRDDELFLKNAIGLTLYSMSSFDSSLVYFEMAFIIANNRGDEKRKAKILNNMGNVYTRLGNYEKAVEYYLESNAIKERLLENMKGKAPDDIKAEKGDLLKSIMNIGSIYSLLDKEESAMEYFDKALDMAMELENKGSECKILNNLGVIMNKRGDFQKALSYHQKALQIRDQVNDIKGKAVSYHNLGNVYSNLKKFDQAIYYYIQALAIKRDISDRYGEANTLLAIGKAYLEGADYLKARSYLDNSLSIALNINSNIIVKECYELYARLSKETGDYKSALSFIEKYDYLKDSISSEEHSRKIAGLQVKYESERRERDNELLRKEVEFNKAFLRRQSTVQSFLIAFALLMMLAGIMVYNLYKLRRRTSLLLVEKNEQLNRNRDKLTGSENRLKKLNATKEKLLRIIGHDIKNPLGSFVSLVSILHDTYNDMDKDEKREFLHHTAKSCLMTSQLLDNLTEWSKLQKDNFELKNEPFDLNDAINSSLMIVKIRADEKNITIRNLVKSGSTIVSDIQALSTVFRNIISNAVKFTPDGGEIEIGLIEKPGKIQVFVRDNGVGIEENDLKKLFRIDTNYALIGNSPEKGTGLGLIICKEIIQRLGGEIHADSEPGRGSIFYIGLPAKNHDG